MSDYEQPYDWEQERERYTRRGRRGDGSFVTHWELAEHEEEDDRRFLATHDYIHSVEERLLTEAGKRVIVDAATSGIARIFAVVVGVLVALILTNIVHVSNPFN